MRFVCDRALLNAQIRNIRCSGLENTIARASDDELGKAYALIQHHQRDFDTDNVALMIAFLRASPAMSEFAKTLTASHDSGVNDPEEEALTEEDSEDSPGQEDGDTTEGDQLATNPPHAYDEASVQECADHCVMSGALHPHDKLKRRNSNDNLVCTDDVETMLHEMPWKILRGTDIPTLGLLDDPTMIAMIPDEWRTTAFGVARACVDQHSHGDSGTDLTMMAALAIRGGMVLKNGDVEYPEDIVGMMSANDRRYDEEYWTMLAEQGDMGRVWKQVFPDRYPGDGAMQED